ncbi:unnamed protein product [Cylicocyclus nassatus]|uniref:Uncharacterized protein n=1 Tax=Cylicocyclus nassatus TaxID=53992 RepID=A0AA36HAY2_CYLNA|nr:unnamed protein product [Cylicocyclus nassatus]
MFQQAALNQTNSVVNDVMNNNNNTYLIDYLSYPLEFVLHFVGLIITIFLVSIANRLKEFHLNLRFLLSIACVLFLVTVITRLMWLVSKFTGLLVILYPFLTLMVTIHDDAFMAFTVTLLLATFERLLATCSISTYERRFQSKPYLYIVASLLIGTVICIEVFVEGGLRKHSTTVFIPIMICMSVTSLLVNLCSYYLNRRFLGLSICAALSHKYQRRENLSALALLVPITTLWSMVNIVQIICLSIMYSDKMREPGHEAFIKLAAHMFTQVSALFSLVAPIILIYRHPRFRYKSELILCKRDRRTLPRLSPKRETEAYFLALTNSLNPNIMGRNRRNV